MRVTSARPTQKSYRGGLFVLPPAVLTISSPKGSLCLLAVLHMDSLHTRFLPATVTRCGLASHWASEAKNPSVYRRPAPCTLANTATGMRGTLLPWRPYLRLVTAGPS